MTLPIERRRQLQELGLRALIKRRFGPDVAGLARPAVYGGGAAIVATGEEDGGENGGERRGGLAAVFADSPTGLASAIDLTERERADHLYFFAEANSPDVARRADQFRIRTTVINPTGDMETLVAEAGPKPSPIPEALRPAGVWMAAAGLDVEWEHDVLTGEVLGLEVARATDLGLEGVATDVGVGKHDREANRLLYPDGPTDELLANAASIVTDLRRRGAPVHPANQLAPERWLRAVIRQRPDLIGFDAVHAGPPPGVREDLRARSIAPAWARDDDGSVAVIVFSVGVDPDVVALAADARLQAPGWIGFPPEFSGADGSLRLIIVVPEGDDHALTRRTARLLRQPAEIVTVPTDWRASPYAD